MFVYASGGTAEGRSGILGESVVVQAGVTSALLRGVGDEATMTTTSDGVVVASIRVAGFLPSAPVSDEGAVGGHARDDDGAGDLDDGVEEGGGVGGALHGLCAREDLDGLDRPQDFERDGDDGDAED